LEKTVNCEILQDISFWDLTTCSLPDSYQLGRGTYYLLFRVENGESRVTGEFGSCLAITCKVLCLGILKS